MWVTAQALLALRRTPFPILTVPRERKAAKAGAREAAAAPARPPARERPPASRGSNEESAKREGRPPAHVSTRAELVRLRDASSRETPAEDEDGPSLALIALAGVLTLVAVWLGRRQIAQLRYGLRRGP